MPVGPSSWSVPAVAAIALGALCSPALGQWTSCVSVDSGGVPGNDGSGVPSISADGRYVAFQSTASNLVAHDINPASDVFVRDRQNGTTELVSVTSAGAQVPGSSSNPRISADGRFVVLQSSGSLAPGGLGGQVYVHDRQTGQTELVSVDSSGVSGNDWSVVGGISADGRYIAFESNATNLVAGDTNAAEDAFVHDRQTGLTERVSVSSGGAQANNFSYGGTVSDDGRYVSFSSWGSNLVAGDTNAGPDVFVRDRQSGITECVSVDPNGVPGNLWSGAGSISADGRYVIFSSVASNLVIENSQFNWYDVFVRDRQNGTTELVSVNSDEEQGNLHSYGGGSISADGRFVVFISGAGNLVANDGTVYDNLFVRDRQLGLTDMLDVDSNGVQGNFHAGTRSMSADGRYIAFESGSDNLVPGDANDRGDVFVRDYSAPISMCAGDETVAACPCGNSGLPGRGCENSSSTGGALLTSSGYASLSADTFVLTSSGEKPTAFSLFLQGNLLIAPTNFGDGLRCTGGALKRLYAKSAASGTVVAPQGAEPSVSARSAALGDTIPASATRLYQVYYRDPAVSFCPSPTGGTFNASNALRVRWTP